LTIATVGGTMASNPMVDGIRLGIDFGTTHTVVAACDRGNHPVIGFADTDEEWRDTYPSVVAERDGELRFGLRALDVAEEPGWVLVRSFKRWLSDPAITPDSEVELGAATVGVLDLLTRFLTQLRADLIERSNAPVPLVGGTVMTAAVATPAHARSAQRFLTLEAFRAAGFEVDAMIAEPSAAAVEYGRRYAKTFSANRTSIVVYDLGGGTFDASFLRIHGRSHEVVSSTGLSRVGGDDFDTELANLAVADLDALSAESRRRLLEQCRLQKERLTPSTRRVVLELGACLTAGDRDRLGITEDEAATVTTAALYEACAPMIEATIEATDRMLAAQGMDEVAGIYLVGGASALPAVGRRLRAKYGRRVHRTAYPSAATAIGLAIAFDPSSPVDVADRFARKFGVFRDDRAGAEVSFDPIFDLDTAIPLAGRTVATRTYRAAHNVGHYRFVECDALGEEGVPCGEVTPFADVYFPFDATLQAADDLTRVPIARTDGEWPLIEERYSIDINGIVDLTITAVDAGYQQIYRLGAV